MAWWLSRSDFAPNARPTVVRVRIAKSVRLQSRWCATLDEIEDASTLLTVVDCWCWIWPLLAGFWIVDADVTGRETGDELLLDGLTLLEEAAGVAVEEKSADEPLVATGGGCWLKDPTTVAWGRGEVLESELKGIGVSVDGYAVVAEEAEPEPEPDCLMTLTKKAKWFRRSCRWLTSSPWLITGKVTNYFPSKTQHEVKPNMAGCYKFSKKYRSTNSYADEKIRKKRFIPMSLSDCAVKCMYVWRLQGWHLAESWRLVFPHLADSSSWFPSRINGFVLKLTSRPRF